MYTLILAAFAVLTSLPSSYADAHKRRLGDAFRSALKLLNLIEAQGDEILASFEQLPFPLEHSKKSQLQSLDLLIEKQGKTLRKLARLLLAEYQAIDWADIPASYEKTLAKPLRELLSTLEPHAYEELLQVVDVKGQTLGSLRDAINQVRHKQGRVIVREPNFNSAKQVRELHNLGYDELAVAWAEESGDLEFTAYDLGDRRGRQRYITSAKKRLGSFNKVRKRLKKHLVQMGIDYAF
jgi:hypothetical protein